MGAYVPLAERMRASELSEMVGQGHLLGQGKALSTLVAKGHIHSMVLWGPAGTGKTTLAKILAKAVVAQFRAISAVHDGVKEIKAVVEEAKVDRSLGQRSVLFVDEIHRFNKAQQDALLPSVESGLLTLIGATTENPSFSLNNALLSRARVYVLKPLTPEELEPLLFRALSLVASENNWESIEMDEQVLPWLIHFADGDARKLLNTLEQLIDFVDTESQTKRIALESASVVMSGGQVRRFDRQGEYFYDQISALHKSIRGSDVQASIYWFMRMLDGGVDPMYLARRLIRVASEDIGNADPRALSVAMDGLQMYSTLGTPEGELGLLQVVTYLATAPKSNAVYAAFKASKAFVSAHSSDEVPMHLRNAPTKLMKGLDYGQGYRYAHNEPHAYATNVNYFPDTLAEDPPSFYQPTDRGFEQTLQQRMAFWRQLDQTSEGDFR